jgi:5-methylcytosine-specific restriction endonuclease McrA
VLTLHKNKTTMVIFDFFNNKKEEINQNAEQIYQNKLKDKRWKIKREIILKMRKYRCEICKSKENLQIHHRKYIFNMSKNKFVDPWEYEEDDLLVLCESCHKRGHELYTVPIKYIH